MGRDLLALIGGMFIQECHSRYIVHSYLEYSICYGWLLQGSGIGGMESRTALNKVAILYLYSGVRTQFYIKVGFHFPLRLEVFGFLFSGPNLCDLHVKVLNPWYSPRISSTATIGLQTMV